MLNNIYQVFFLHIVEGKKEAIEKGVRREEILFFFFNVKSEKTIRNELVHVVVRKYHLLRIR